MRTFKKSILTLLCCTFVFGLWYDWKFSMGIADKYEVNSPTLENRLLIATQQSKYKDKVTRNITDYLKNKNVFVSVIDVTDLESNMASNFDAFVIIHTYEIWMPPKKVRKFINVVDSNNLIAISTSGDGNLFPPGVDGISGASILTNSEKDAQFAIEWLNSKFNLSS